MTETQSKPHSLPEGWTWTTIGEISERIHYGYTAKSSKETIGPKMLRITDIQDRAVNWDSVPYCRIDEEKKPNYLLKDADLVFARTGATVGKSFLIKGAIPEAVFASYLIRVIFPPQIRKKFVYYFFQSPSYWLQIFEGKIGIGQPNVNATKLSKLSIPLSPFPEQGRIVSKLEELFTRLDAGVESLRNVKAQLQLYRQAVLNHAFNGRLTEEWRKTHKNTIQPATKLLERIHQERKKKEKGKYRENKKIDTSKLPEIPETWTWTFLGQIRLNRSKSIAPKKTPNKLFELYSVPSFDSKIPDVVLGKDIGSNKQIVEENTVLLCKINPRINRVWVVGNHTPHLKIASTEWIPFFSIEGINPEYLCFFMKNNHFRNFLASNVSGVGGSLMRINTRTFSNYPFPLPSLLEQQAIVEEIKQRFSVMEEVLKSVELSELKTEILRQSILKTAFEGRLVAQNPSDESADLLLERIKQEKHSNKKQGTKRRKKSKNYQRRLNGYVE